MTEKKNHYSIAKRRYAELLGKSRNALPPDDPSVLKVLEKLTAILAEYPDKRDISIRNKCLNAVAAAQNGKLSRFNLADKV